MGKLPAEARAMTPAETALLIRGWNAAQAGDRVEPPGREELEALMEQYPDE